MTAADRAAEDALKKYEIEIGWANLNPEAYSSFEAGFVAGSAWQGEQVRPALTREQIIYVLDDGFPSVLTLTDAERMADVLLAQGDVPKFNDQGTGDD